jgi:plasmid stabilization system protein ParE
MTFKSDNRDFRQDREDRAMPRGDKSKYTDKQKRTAQHIADSYEDRGVPEPEAEARAWATVNKRDGGGKSGGRLARHVPKRAETTKP